MNIQITDEEQAALKARVLQQVEQQLREDVLRQLREQVVRELTRVLRADVTEKLTLMLQEHITEEKLRAVINKALMEMGGKGYAAGEGVIYREVRAAVTRVAEKHAVAVADEMKRLVYTALSNGVGIPIGTGTSEPTGG